MTTHYILADDYERWNPGEPIEDIDSGREYFFEQWLYLNEPYRPFEYWLKQEVLYGNIRIINTDTEGRVLS